MTKIFIDHWSSVEINIEHQAEYVHKKIGHENKTPTYLLGKFCMHEATTAHIKPIS